MVHRRIWATCCALVLALGCEPEADPAAPADLEAADADAAAPRQEAPDEPAALGEPEAPGEPEEPDEPAEPVEPAPEAPAPEEPAPEEPAPQAPAPPCELAFAPGPELFPGADFRGALARCAGEHRAFVAAADVRLRLTVELGAGELGAGGVDAGEVEVEVATPTGEPLAAGAGRRVVLEITTREPGEVRVALARTEGAGPYAGRLECLQGCEREATRFPIVLVHGAGGTDRYFGLLDYFYRVPGHLAEAGYRVYTPSTMLIGHSRDRAAMLADFLDGVLAETGADKVHLIGHSQGGLDIRVLASALGYADRIASMTTIATPHRGLRFPVPDWFPGMSFGEDYLMGDFAREYPDVPGIPRFSWAGWTCGLLEMECREAMNGEIVSPLFSASYRAIRLMHHDDDFRGANDGLVPVQSAIWGELLGVLPADHLDEIGQLAERNAEAFDHLAFYLAEARRLRALEIEQAE